jgi:ATP-dependent DNA helicase UvrD/PcrA
MKFIADLHIHSRFSRATSRDLDPEHLAIWAKKKGIDVIGTGDFTHPGWVSELQEKVIEAENGLYRLRPELEKKVEDVVPGSCSGPARFLLSGEISCIYKKDGRTRKVHNLVLMPDFEALSRFNERLDRIGNITSDGRPILGLDAKDLLEIALEVSEKAFFIPAHIWTPWFSLFGSKSGFDTLEECFGDLSRHIHALETGLSSDPPMNRLLSALDGFLLVSNSDAHSPGKLGREANLFDVPLDYDRITGAMAHGEGFEGTIEFFPEEGKYHFDGHRKCQVCLHPKETRACKGICPTCGKPLTVGVLHRIDELADRDVPELSKPFYSLIPLTEILSEILGTGPATKRVLSAYEELLAALGPELQILMDVPSVSIEKAGGILLAKAIDRMRRTQVIRQGGYDGEYGIIRLFGESEMSELIGQTSLFQHSKEMPATDAKLFPSETNLQNDYYINDPMGRAELRETDLSKPTSDPILDPLNPAQRRAVLHTGGPLLIVAGPGTGKTMTLTHRIVHQLRSGTAVPEQILALTFTNKAADEMRERISNLLRVVVPPEKGHGQRLKDNKGSVRVATFHGFCLEVLRQEGTHLNLPADFTLCSEQDVPILARQAQLELGVGKKKMGQFLKNLSRLKTASVMSVDLDPDLKTLQPFFEAYNGRLRALNMFDLDDLEVETLRLFLDYPDICTAHAERFPRVFVDEYQDTNPIQVELLKALFHADSLSDHKEMDSPDQDRQQAVSREICAIGDPDQSIYGFRGSDVGNFHRFEEDFDGTTKIVLDRNYRSTQLILDGASALMGGETPLKATVGKGVPINLASSLTQSEEAEMIVEQIEKLLGGTTYFSLDSGRVASHEEGEDLSFGDVAILFRLNAQGDALGEALARAGIPFIRSGEKPLIERYPVNMLWRLLQALQYPDNPYYRDVYLAFPDIEPLQGEEALRRLNREDPISVLIDQAVHYHGLEENPERPAEALQRFRKMATYFIGDLSPFLDALSLERGIDHMGLSGDRVALMSLHAAKGLEWPVVIITGCEDGLIPLSLFQESDEAEEKRLFYVGMTRARRRLILSCVGRRNINGRTLQLEPSPFLRLIPEGLCTPLARGEWKRKKPAHQQLALFQT